MKNPCVLCGEEPAQVIKTEGAAETSERGLCRTCLYALMIVMAKGDLKAFDKMAADARSYAVGGTDAVCTKKIPAPKG